jgi:hypothetical protein
VSIPRTKVPDPVFQCPVTHGPLLRSLLSRRGIAIGLSGIDGCGKTTACGQLGAVLESAGISVARFHLHQWYKALLLTPFIVLVNRYFGKRALIFDRSIYDNIAVFFSPRPWLRRWLPMTIRLIRVAHPQFDYRFYLVASIAETIERRPNTDPVNYAALAAVYEEIVDAAAYQTICSDSTSLERVLEALGRVSG